MTSWPTSHDMLCPATELNGWIKGNCQCVLIHKVRQDEKDKS